MTFFFVFLCFDVFASLVFFGLFFAWFTWCAVYLSLLCLDHDVFLCVYFFFA